MRQAIDRTSHRFLLGHESGLNRAQGHEQAIIDEFAAGRVLLLSKKQGHQRRQHGYGLALGVLRDTGGVR